MPSNTLLFISGNGSVQRNVFENLKMGYWSRAFPSLLDKRGVLDCHHADHEALNDSTRLKSSSALIVAWLPESFWTPQAVANLLAFKGPIFLEGPLPESLAMSLGIRSKSKSTVTAGTLRLKNPKFEKILLDRHKHYLWSPSQLSLTEKKITTDEKKTIANNAEFGYSQDPEWVKVWGQTPYWIPEVDCPVEQELVSLHSGDFKTSLFIKKDNIMCSTFQCLAYLSHFHTVEPLDHAFYDCPAQSRLIIEEIVFHLLQSHIVENGSVVLATHPWPWNKQYGMTVRHDVDRIPNTLIFSRLLQFERENHLGVSWYWIPDRQNVGYMGEIEDAGHENGLHTMKLNEKKAEVEALIQSFPRQRRIFGEFLHGGGGGDYWRGAPVITKADEQKLLYSEGLSTIYDFPYWFPFMQSDGTIQISKTLAMSHTRSIDAFPKKFPEKYQSFQNWIHEHIDCGYYTMLLNHPDKNFDTFAETVDGLPAGRVDWTCKQVADWWVARKNIHVVTVESDAASTVWEITSPTDLWNLSICLQGGGDRQIQIWNEGQEEWFRPTQKVESKYGQPILSFRLDLINNKPCRVRLASDLIPPKGKGPGAFDLKSVLDLLPDSLKQAPNSQMDYLESRVDKMIEAASSFSGISDFGGAQVLDIGCGYGTTSLAFYLKTRPAHYLGIDANSRYMGIASGIVERLGLQDIHFEQGYMDNLSPHVKDNQFDLMIVNNAINFLISPRLVQKAMREWYRVLKPGGALVCLTPNRLFFREAFTKVPFLQFWPNRWANGYVKMKKLREHYTDIRLPSPFELSRWAKQSGFRDCEVWDSHRLSKEGWMRFFRPRFFFMARK